MEVEIVPGIDGLYAVCFYNNKAYNTKKIFEIFGRYGHVISVRHCEKEGGQMVFVRYKEYKEVKNCLDDRNNTHELAVKVAYPSKKLVQGVPNQQTRKKPGHNNFKHGNGQIRNVHPKLRNQHFEKGKYSKDFERTKQSNEVTKSEDSADHITVNRYNSHISDDDTQSTGNAEGKVNDGNRDVTHSDKEGSIKNSDIRGQMSQSGHTTTGTGETEGKVNDDNRDVTHSDKEGSLKNSDNRGQMLQRSHTTNGVNDDGPPPLVAIGVNDDGPPPLVASEDLTDDDDEEPVVYAKDVIVANLPQSVDEYDVKRFAWRHDLNPVHISPIEKTGIKYNILFCHLWMENDYEAEMAEIVLRGARMEGNTLLVARAENLLSAFRDGVSTFETS